MGRISVNAETIENLPWAEKYEVKKDEIPDSIPDIEHNIRIVIPRLLCKEGVVIYIIIPIIIITESIIVTILRKFDTKYIIRSLISRELNSIVSHFVNESVIIPDSATKYMLKLIIANESAVRVLCP